MVVEDTRTVREEIEALVEGMSDRGAYVVAVQEHGGEGGKSPRVNLTLRIPAPAFDETLDRLAAMGSEVLSRSATAQDVTEEYVDLAARLESLEAARDRLLEIVEEAETTEDLLRAEQQLTQREATIESIKGRLQYLEQSAQLSSIRVELHPDIVEQPIDDSWRPARSVRAAFDTLLESLRDAGDGIIYFTIAVLPWLLLAGLILYGIVRFALARYRHSHPEVDAAEE